MSIEPFAASTPAILTESLRKQFGDFVAIKGLNLRIEDGENFALLGPNGAGKSTLIRILTTLTVATSGRVRILGHDVRQKPDVVRKLIGVVPQSLTSDPDLTAQENLDFYGRLYSIPRAQCQRMSDELLAAVNLSDWRHKMVGTFSGGMRRRLEVARSLMHEPRVLFLDEPTTGLDPASRIAMWEMIRDLKSHSNLTILLTTHYMDEAEELCNRVAIFDHGQLTALGSPAELQSALPELDEVQVRFDRVPDDMLSRLEGLSGVIDVSVTKGLWTLKSLARMETAADIITLSKDIKVTPLSLVVRGYDLEDIFVEYTGRDTRDAVKG